MIRSVAVAVGLTPTIVPIPGLHGSIPMPAIIALYYGLVDYGNYETQNGIVCGSIPLLVSFLLFWLGGYWVSRFFGKDKLNHSPEPTPGAVH